MRSRKTAGRMSISRGISVRSAIEGVGRSMPHLMISHIGEASSTWASKMHKDRSDLFHPRRPPIHSTGAEQRRRRQRTCTDPRHRSLLRRTDEIRRTADKKRTALTVPFFSIFTHAVFSLKTDRLLFPVRRYIWSGNFLSDPANFDEPSFISSRHLSFFSDHRWFFTHRLSIVMFSPLSLGPGFLTPLL